jgi:hypothetical protein
VSIAGTEQGPMDMSGFARDMSENTVNSGSSKDPEHDIMMEPDLIFT